MLLAIDLPGGPEPPLLEGTHRLAAQGGLMVLALAGFAIALGAPRTGGAVAVVGGCQAGALAAFLEHPIVATAAGALIVAPALVLVLGGRRRTWVAGAVSAALTVVMAGTAFATWRGYAFLYGATHPQSHVPGPPRGSVEWVWAGGVTPTEAVVTAKLRAPSASATLRVVPRARAIETTRDGAIVRFRLSGLRPDSDVRYAVQVGPRPDASGQGAFRTVPDGPASFAIAFSSCARTGSNGVVFDAIRQERPLMYLNLGDLFYANIATADPARFERAYDRVLTRPAQANLFRSTSTTYVWDDHDFGPNDADGTSASAPAAHSVFRSLVPSHRLALPGDRAPLARAFTIGRVRFVITDTRSARSPKGVVDDGAKTMLGAAQRRWLERKLLEARDRYPVIVWVNPDPWIGRPRAGSDSWAGYSTERAALAEFIVRNRIGGIVMLSGDSHAVAIDDGTNSGYAAGGRGGFPVFHAGALDRAPQHKGGPYSHGEFLGGGQYGIVRVDDRGGASVTVTLQGRDWRGRELTSLRRRFAAPPAVVDAVT